MKSTIIEATVCLCIIILNGIVVSLIYKMGFTESKAFMLVRGLLKPIMPHIIV
jgi:hypothetical protein